MTVYSCTLCRSHYSNELSTLLHGLRICEICYSRLVTCYHCHNINFKRHTVSYDGKYFCSSCCSSLRIRNCENCCCVYRGDQEYCDTCAAQANWRYHRREYLRHPECEYEIGRTYGIELETAAQTNYRNSIQFSRDFRYWNTHRDTTIRLSNREFPIEFCSPVLKGGTGLKHLENFLNSISRYGEFKVNDSCGYHVHFSADDLLEKHIVKLTILWKKIEKWIYKVLNNRENNIHAGKLPYSLNDVVKIKSCKEFQKLVYLTPHPFHRNILPDFRQQIEERHIPSLKSTKRVPPRYFGLNIHNFYYQKRVEIRAHHGTLDTEEIVNWIQFWLKAFDFVKNKTRKDILKLENGLDLLSSTKTHESVISHFVKREEKYGKPTIEISKPQYLNYIDIDNATSSYIPSNPF